jgi:excisionase family DNA binding protein
VFKNHLNKDNIHTNQVIMNLNPKIKPTHLDRMACVYVRQSTASQVQHNQESTRRQYQLVDRAIELGWPKQRVKVIDEDLARSGSGELQRDGFTKMTAEVALGEVGLILSIEVSRVARNNADWYRLLDLCGVTDTLIGDEDGLYHAGMFNDRLLLGLKGTMAEAELHVIRARLEGGIRNKAARGELRRGLPTGFVWGEEDGEVLIHPDEAVSGAIGAVFEKFVEVGSVRQVWLWFRSEGLSFPQQCNGLKEVRWVTPTYTAIHHVLTNPVYAGAYVYGKTRQERYVDQSGRLRKRLRRLPRSQWAVLIQDHHPGYLDWNSYEMNQARIKQNTHPKPHQPGGAVREGAALLQGIATCASCGRRLHVYYQGRNATPGYYCPGSNVANGRAHWCLRVGGARLDAAVATAFLEALAPAGLQAALQAQELLESEHDSALAQWRLQVEQARYQAQRAERRYHSVEPENRLVARTLEADWEKRLDELAAAEAELARREQQRPAQLTDEERAGIDRLGEDLNQVWNAPTTTGRDRKELLRALVEEVSIALNRDQDQPEAHLTLRWKGGMFTELRVALWHPRESVVRTDEDTIELVRRLAVYYPDATIAGILNRQGRKTARGLRFTSNRVSSVRQHWKIPCFRPSDQPPEGQPVTVERAAELLGVVPSTVHRWINEGFIPAEQITPGAPWRIRMNEQIRSRFVEATPEGYVPMIEATKLLGVSRQTILQRVKRGELEAVHLCKGRRKGLRIKVLDDQPSLFDAIASEGV